MYGELGPDDPPFSETTAYAPSSPYAASKAASDHFVRAFQRTYGLPTLITNCSNNYGPRQFPEKLIPLMITNALEGSRLPLYGQGTYIRDWLYVEDHCRAIQKVLEGGVPGETYAIGGKCEKRNVDIVTGICRLLDQVCPLSPHRPHEQLISYVQDRQGHDFRYAIDCSRIERELGWAPQETLDSGLLKTVGWYLANPGWVKTVRTGTYRAWIHQQYDSRLKAGSTSESYTAS